MSQILIQDNLGKIFLFDTATATRQPVGGSIETAEEQFGPIITRTADLPASVRSEWIAEQQRFIAQRSAAQNRDISQQFSSGEISADVRLTIGGRKIRQGAAAVFDAPAQPEGPSFAEQARLLFPFIPEALVGEFASSWEKFGDPNLALAEIRQSPRYETFFPGIRREDGTLRMTEAEYTSTVEGYRRRLGQFGVPVDSILTPEKKKALIQGEVSADEFGQRLNATYSQIVTNIGAVRDFYAQNFGAGGLSDAAIFASALDPTQSPLELQNQIETAQIGGEAALRGFGIGIEEARRLESFGLDQQAARSLFGQAQQQLPRLNELITRFNNPDDELTLREFSDAVVINDPTQLAEIGVLLGQSRSSFSRAGGFQEDRSGALTGLLEQ